MSESHRQNKKNIRISDELYIAATEIAKEARPASTIRNVVEYALERYLSDIAADPPGEPYRTKPKGKK